jgi:hypothetical protein
MKNVTLNLPTFGFVVATRAMIGVGLGLLLSERFSDGKRRTVGKTLLTIGAASTLPAIIAIMRGRQKAELSAVV